MFGCCQQNLVKMLFVSKKEGLFANAKIEAAYHGGTERHLGRLWGQCRDGWVLVND
jgi:hypothetical protein